MKKILLTLTCSLIIGTLNASSGQDSINEKYNYRLQKIEDYRLIDDRKFENKSKELDLKSKELDLKIEEYKEQKTILDIIALTVGSFSIMSLFGFWQKAKNIAEKKIDEKFEKLLNDKRQQLISIMDSHDKESQLKKNSKICIVASENAKIDFIQSFFVKLGFNQPTIKKVSKYEAIGETYDVLLLYREEENSPLDENIAKEYINNNGNNSIAFVFGKHIGEISAKKRFSSATFWSQLYGNMISALKYQELIDQSYE